MDTLIGWLTAVIAALLVTISFGALALVITGATLPSIPRAKPRRPQPSASGSGPQLTAPSGDENASRAGAKAPTTQVTELPVSDQDEETEREKDRRPFHFGQNRMEGKPSKQQQEGGARERG